MVLFPRFFPQDSGVRILVRMIRVDILSAMTKRMMETRPPTVHHSVSSPSITHPSHPVILPVPVVAWPVVATILVSGWWWDSKPSPSPLVARLGPRIRGHQDTGIQHRKAVVRPHQPRLRGLAFAALYAPPLLHLWWLAFFRGRETVRRHKVYTFGLTRPILGLTSHKIATCTVCLSTHLCGDGSRY